MARREIGLLSAVRNVLIAAATLALAVAAGAVTALPAGAATPECGQRCITVFSRALGTYAQPAFVEAVRGGVARIGQPVILQRADSTDPAQDLIVPRAGLVSEFFAAGLVPARVNRHFGELRAVQIEFAPRGAGTGLCVGLAAPAYQNEGLTLQPCTVPATTVWIIDTADSPATAPDGFYPLVNGSTRNVVRPFVMDYPRHAHPAASIRVRHLTFRGPDCGVPDRQLWGSRFGVLE